MTDTPYKKIINQSRPVSVRHPKMSLLDRAAQFSPFAALSGFEDGIKETARVTSSKIELDENEKNLINEKLTQLMMAIPNHPTVTIKYFVNDTRKSGGEYQTKTAQVRKLDLYRHMLVLEDNTSISIENLIHLDIK